MSRDLPQRVAIAGKFVVACAARFAIRGDADTADAAITIMAAAAI